MTARGRFVFGRAWRLLPLLLVLVASLAFGREARESATVSAERPVSGPTALSSSTPLATGIRDGLNARTSDSPNLAVVVNTTVPWGTIVNDPYLDVTVSICWDAGTMSSHSVTSPNGVVIEDAAGNCPYGMETLGYFVRWATTLNNPLDVGDNHIYIEHCDQWYQCTQIDGLIRYYPMLDSLEFIAQPTPSATLGGYDTTKFVIKNIHSALSYTYDSVAVTCHAGVGDCTIIGDDELNLPNRGRDSIMIRFRGDTVGASAVSLVFCRPGPICFGRSQSAAVLPADPVARSVAVTPVLSTTSKGGSANFSLSYTVQNTGSTTTTFTLEAACDASVILSGCSVQPSVTLNASQSTSIAVGTLTSTNPGSLTTGAVRLTALANNARATGQTAVTVGPGGGAGGTPAITVTTAAINPSGSVSRDQCLMLAAGDAAGVECADLRLAHGLPTFQTMAKPRGAALIYLSRHAEGVPLLFANVRSLHGDPDSVTLTLTINGTNQVRTVAWPAGCNNHECRVALAVKPGGNALATGWYQYSLQATMTVGGTPYSSAADTGSIAVVNRRSTPFGRGWWLQGFEQLVHLAGDSTRKLWIGGDGSTRLYKKISINSSIFTSVYAVSRVDTLQRHGTNDWRRRLPNGAFVRFNSTGKHTRTVGVLGDTTVWSYDGEGTLTRIDLPRRSNLVRPSYQFHYTGTGANRMLDSIRARPDSLSGASRTTKLTRSGFVVTALQDADASQVLFGVDTTTGRVNWRRTRLNDTVFFTYDAAGGVSKTRISMSRTADADVIQEICSSETRSLAQCTWGQATPVAGVPVPDVVTRVDGPRSGLVDVMTFYINKFGSPDTLQAPDGTVTRLQRDTIFPALVAKVSRPLGQYTQAWYNNRGLVDSTSAPGVGAQRAVTRVYWNSKWNLPDSIRPPIGPRTRFWNRTTRAVVDSQQTGNATSSRVRFTYDTSTSTWQLSGTTQPGMVESYSYDTVLGNVSRVQANDAITRIYRNQWGMDTLSHDRDSDPWLRTTTYRNVLGRVDSTRSRSRAFSYTLTHGGVGDSVPTGTRIVRNTYDAENNLTAVWRGDSASVNSTSASQTGWAYDAARRMRTRVEPVGTDSFFYDAAGNQIRIRNARALTIQQHFDVMGRLIARVLPEVVYQRQGCSACTSAAMNWIPIFFPYYPTYQLGGAYSQDVVIPGDVEYFEYDVLGRMKKANNRDARISRGYEENGALIADTLRIRKYDPTSISFAGATTYALNLSVDKLGRRVQRLDSHGGRQMYFYNDTLGTLTKTVDVFAGGDSLIFEFDWDSAGRMIEYQVPGLHTETMTYDANGRLTLRQAGDYQDSYEYDERGKQTRRATTSSVVALTDTSRMHYDGFGALVALDRYRPYGSWSVFTDEYRVDALGNQRQSGGNRNWNTGRSQYNRTYTGERIASSGANPLSSLRDPSVPTNPLIQRIDTTYYTYDPSGNQISSRQVVLKHQYSTYQLDTAGNPVYTDYWHDGGFVDGDNTRSYYDANNRMRQFERNTRSYNTWHTVQEYRYDALGRRILLRTQRDQATCDGNETEVLPRCIATMERFLWDGDNLMTEYRRHGKTGLSFASLDTLSSAGDFFGTVHYTHGGGIDQPLAVRKVGEVAFLPIRTGRGGFEGGIYTNNGSDMEDFHWPERYSGVQLGGDTRIEAPEALSWFGSLLENKADLSGMVYMRNRYYDPGTGRFTQRDPIGLAGGINQYGYASGDPVNYFDPFGLRDCKKVDCPPIEKVAANKNVTAAGEAMFAESQQDGKERGAFLFNGPDGDIVVGPVITGEAGKVEMGPAPDDAIGMIHTHPDLTVGRPGSPAIPGGPPSGDDYAYAKTNSVHVVTEQRSATFYVPWDNPAGVTQQRRTRVPRGSDQ